MCNRHSNCPVGSGVGHKGELPISKSLLRPCPSLINSFYEGRHFHLKAMVVRQISPSRLTSPTYKECSRTCIRLQHSNEDKEKRPPQVCAVEHTHTCKHIFAARVTRTAPHRHISIDLRIYHSVSTSNKNTQTSPENIHQHTDTYIYIYMLFCRIPPSLSRHSTRLYARTLDVCLSPAKSTKLSPG